MKKFTKKSQQRASAAASRRSRWPLASLMPLVAVLLLAASCGGDGKGESAGNGDGEGAPPTTAGEPVRGGTISVLSTAEYPTLDPVKAGVSTSTSPATELYAVFSALVFPSGPAGEVTMGLAESLTTEDTGTTWILKLRQGLKFSDGTDLDAEAVKFNWDRIKDPATASPSLPSIEGMASYDVVDPLTVEIVLEQTDYQFPRQVAGALTYIGSPTAFQEKGEGFGRAPVGAGPFTLDEWVTNDHLTFVRNPDYWDAPRPYIDELIVRPIVDESGQRVRSFQAGEGDVVVLRDQISNQTEIEEGGATVLRIPSAVGSGLMMNQSIPALGDIRVREAFALTLDRPAILQSVYGEDEPVRGIFRIDSEFYDAENDYPEPDLAEAQSLIDEYIDESGEDITLTYSGVAGVVSTTRMAEVIKAQLEELEGVTIEISLVDVATLIQDNNAGRAELGAAAIQGPWPDPALYDQFHSTGLQNNSGYSSEATDAALDAAHATESLPEQYDAYKDVAASMLADMAFIPLRHSVYALGSQPDVWNVQSFGDSGFLSDQAWIDG